MRKKLLSLVLMLSTIIALLFMTRFALEEYLSNVFKQDIQLEKFSLYPLEIQTSSLGGNAKLSFKDNSLILNLEKVSLSSFEKINKTKTRKTMIVNTGKISGFLKYNVLNKISTSNLSASNVIINGIDLDRKLLFYNDVLGFNIVNLFRNYLQNIDYSNKTTKISQLQFSATMKEGMISLNDVAFASKNFRIVLIGDIHNQGHIDNFEVYLIDRNGCSIISQRLSGNIKDPQIQKIKTLEKIVRTVPTSMFSTGMKMANFTKHNIDSVMPHNQRHISNYMYTGTNRMFEKTSDIVMKRTCKVIYTGAVEHPLNYKQGFI
ncbi:MAG: hypothetical protein Q9M43_00165 [Sulfurimonas sp.]|nr:hypothetical protein [Sulfurimonas sp.]